MTSDIHLFSFQYVFYHFYDFCENPVMPLDNVYLKTNVTLTVCTVPGYIWRILYTEKQMKIINKFGYGSDEAFKK